MPPPLFSCAVCMEAYTAATPPVIIGCDNHHMFCIRCGPRLMQLCPLCRCDITRGPTPMPPDFYQWLDGSSSSSSDPAQCPMDGCTHSSADGSGSLALVRHVIEQHPMVRCVLCDDTVEERRLAAHVRSAACHYQCRDCGWTGEGWQKPYHDQMHTSQAQATQAIQALPDAVQRLMSVQACGTTAHELTVFAQGLQDLVYLARTTRTDMLERIGREISQQVAHVRQQQAAE